MARVPVVLAVALALVVSMVEPGAALKQVRKHRVHQEPDEAEQQEAPATEEADATPTEQAAEAPAEEAPAEEAPAEEAPAEEAPAEPAAEESEVKSAEPAEEAPAEQTAEEPEVKSAEPAEDAPAEQAAEESEATSAEPAEEAPAEQAAEEPEVKSAEPAEEAPAEQAAEESEAKSAEPAEEAPAEQAAEEPEAKSAEPAEAAPAEQPAEEPEVKSAEPAEEAPAEQPAEEAAAEPGAEESETKSAEPADAAPAEPAAEEPEAKSAEPAEEASQEKPAETAEEPAAEATEPAAEASEPAAEPAVEAATSPDAGVQPELVPQVPSEEPQEAAKVEEESKPETSVEPALEDAVPAKAPMPLEEPAPAEAAKQGEQKAEAGPLTPEDVQAKVDAALAEQALKAGKEAVKYQLNWINGVLADLNANKADPSVNADLKNILRAQADTLPRLSAAEARVNSYKEKLQAAGTDSGLWEKLDKLEDEKYDLDQKLHNEKEKAHFLQTVFENSFSFAHQMALAVQNGITDKLKEVQSAIYDRGDNHWANLQKEGQTLFRDFVAARANLTSMSDKLDMYNARGKKAWNSLLNVSDPTLVKEIDALSKTQANLTDRLAESTWRAKELADQMSQEEIAEAGAEWMELNSSLTEAKDAFQTKYDELLGTAPAEVAQEVQSTFQEYEELKAKVETVKARVAETSRLIQASPEKKELQKLLGSRNANSHLKELLTSVGYVGNLTLADARKRASKKVVEELDNATAQQAILNQKLSAVIAQDEELQTTLKEKADPQLLQAFSAARSDLNEVKAVSRALESDASRFYQNIKDTRDQVIDMEKKVWASGVAQAVWAFHDVKDLLDVSKRVASLISDSAKTMGASMQALAEQEQKAQLKKRGGKTVKEEVKEHFDAAAKIIDQKRKDFASKMNESAKKLQASIEGLRQALVKGATQAAAGLNKTKATPSLNVSAIAAGMKKGYDLAMEAKKRLIASQAVQKQAMEKAKVFSQKVIDAMRAVGEQTLKIEAEKRRPEAKLFRQLAAEAALARKTA